MNQLAMNFDAPALPIARATGERGMQLATDRAERDEPGFSERAQAFVLAYLAEHGKASGEDLTDACKAAGIKPAEDRAFGSVYSALSRRKQIVCVGYCDREKGHGTGGGKRWSLTT